MCSTIKEKKWLGKYWGGATCQGGKKKKKSTQNKGQELQKRVERGLQLRPEGEEEGKGGKAEEKKKSIGTIKEPARSHLNVVQRC